MNPIASICIWYLPTFFSHKKSTISWIGRYTVRRSFHGSVMGMDRTSTRPSVAPSSVYQDLCVCVCFFGFTVFLFLLFELCIIPSSVQFVLFAAWLFGFSRYNSWWFIINSPRVSGKSQQKHVFKSWRWGYHKFVSTSNTDFEAFAAALARNGDGNLPLVL